MSARIFQLRSPRLESRGTVHVMPAHGGGYEIGHESASGNSWGSFETFATAQAAITAAYALNRDQYGGTCDVSVCDAALADVAGASRPPPRREDF